MANKISQVLTFEAKQAIQELVNVEDGLDNVESKGKLVANALNAMATNIDADLKGTTTAADALAKALGPEMADRIGRNGIEGFVTDLKGVGLTSDQIVTDVDELAGAIKHLDDVGKQLDGPKQGLKDVGDSAIHAKTELGQVRDEADNSKSVLANMVGNSAQDVAQLGGVAGTAGMALGQLGEYATEGNISLSGLAKVAGPMALVTVASLGITSALKDMAKVDAFKLKQVQDWADAIRQGGDAIDNMVEKAKKTEKIESYLFNGIKDITPDLAQLGLTADQFFQMIDGGTGKLAEFFQKSYDGTKNISGLVDVIRSGTTDQEAWSTALRDAGVHNSALTNVVQAGTIAIKDKKRAEEEGAVAQTVYGDSAEAAAAKAEAASKKYSDQVATTSSDVQRNIDEMQAKWDQLNGNINAEKSMIQYRQQVADVKQAIADAGAAELQFGVGSPEAIAAKDNARLKTLELESTTANLGEKILGLPEEQVTNLIARIDRGELDNMPDIVQDKLNSKDYRISVHLDTIKIDGETHAAGSTTLHVNGKSNVIQSAAGGYFPPRPGGYTVNLAEAGRGEWVVPEDQMRGGGGPGGGTIIVNIYNAGYVMAKEDLIRDVVDGIVDGQRRGAITAGFLVSP